MKIRFGNVTFDPTARQLLRGREAVHLSPKAFDLLALLIDRRPAVVEKGTLRQHLWPGTHVVEANLGNLVSEIRSALGDDANTLAIRTVHGVGYAVEGPETAAPSGPRHWLVWNQAAIVLTQEENVIGRDPACAVWIEESGVSRRHARITLTGAGAEREASIEDLGSTNGTFVGDRPVKSVQTLRDGDVIRIADASLTYRSWKDSGTPTKKVRKPRVTDTMP